MSTKKQIKERPGGSAAELANKPHHGGNVQAEAMDIFAAEQLGVGTEEYRDIRAVGNPPEMDEAPEPDRGKEFSGPGRQHDPDRV
ncbi:MAG: hypothetical protein GX774_14240 [Armatimonadetes bacterium]|nr:hypothetical protein [Armatimonadota bacterium]